MVWFVIEPEKVTPGLPHVITHESKNSDGAAAATLYK